MLFCTSTTGVSPVTVIVSWSPPTRRSALSVTVTPVCTCTPSLFTVEKPGRVYVTEYVPADRLSRRNWPDPSVTALRTFSISAGLVASTVTPGSTAPEASRTTPAMDCADTIAGMSATSTAASDKRIAAARL